MRFLDDPGQLFPGDHDGAGVPGKVYREAFGPRDAEGGHTAERGKPVVRELPGRPGGLKLDPAPPVNAALPQLIPIFNDAAGNHAGHCGLPGADLVESRFGQDLRMQVLLLELQDRSIGKQGPGPELLQRGPGTTWNSI